MKRVLLISWYYPPMPATGSLRAKGLAKFLPEFGWDVTVLHGSPDYKGGWLHRLLRIDPNQNLMAQAEEVKRKLHVPEWVLRMYAEGMAYPDATGDWLEQQIMNDNDVKAFGRWWLKEVLEHHIDAIISTSSPVSCHIIAKRLKQSFGSKWIADFRDLWAQNHYYPYGNIRKHYERKLELKTLKDADALVTVSKPLAEALSDLHGKPAVVIGNGYDPDEVSDGSTPLVGYTEELTITYTGSIYRGKQSMPDDGLKVRYYGTPMKWLPKGFVQYGVVSREEVLMRQRESHLLLLLKWKGEKGIITQKIYEYMAARRPIMAVGEPDEDVDRMVEDANRGEIEQYSQREMARKYAELLEGVTG